MSEQQFEENLNYGDNVNFVGRIRDILGNVYQEIKKTIDERII